MTTPDYIQKAEQLLANAKNVPAAELIRGVLEAAEAHILAMMAERDQLQAQQRADKAALAYFEEVVYLDGRRLHLQQDGASVPEVSPEKVGAVVRERDQLRARVSELEALISSPQTTDFLEAVRIEAAHQRERWGKEHDQGKAPEDWFWTLGYLAGKALHAGRSGDHVKHLHHLISSAALLANQHREATT